MIKINDLSARLHRYSIPLQNATAEVISSGWLVLGPQVKKFEQAFSDYLGVNHCVGVGNGTDAIELALRAVGVSHSDHVATVANAGMYTTTAASAIGAEPLYMDVEIDSKNATLDEVARAIDCGVKAVVVTHLYGLAISDIEAIADLCRRKKIPLIEDCAQAHGAKLAGRRVGTFGDVASFSFYPTKNLGALGDGGAVVTSNEEFAARVKLLRQYGWSSKYSVSAAGGRNSRLDEIQAAVLSVFLPDLDDANTRRRSIARQYNQSIRHPEVRLPTAFGEEYVAHLYVVRTRKRADFRKHLGNHGVASEIHYPVPDHRQPVFKGRFDTQVLRNTEQLADEIVTLPLYPEMTDQDVARVIEVVNAW